MNTKFSLRQIVFYAVLVWTVFSFVGCARYPVRHLASDASLIVPGHTTKKDVVSYMGPPDKKVDEQEQKEVWYYYEAKKSLLRKTPYIGNRLGQEEYDIVIISYSGDVVDTCTFRLMDEEGFKKTGIKAGESSGPE